VSVPSTTQEIVTNPHIVLNEKGRAVVRGTRSKVTMIVRDHVDGGMTPAEIHDGYPHLSLAAIHAALSYYYDHKAALDAEMLQGDHDAEQILRELDASGKRLTKAELESRARQPDVLP
jgi:uncharacterized protein (DUF433 family)